MTLEGIILKFYTEGNVDDVMLTVAEMQALLHIAAGVPVWD